MRREPGRLEDERFDVAVVGGGIHGAWIARRAARAGYRVALIERNDFGAATSANSLKILHGGLRYLQHLDLPRMRSSIRARREFLRATPHLARPLPCVMPLQSFGLRSPWMLWPALLLNDLISADRNSGVSGPNRLPRGALLSAQECRAQLHSLIDSDSVAGARWWDGLAIDTFRLVLDALLQAVDDGAVVCNRVEAIDWLRDGESVVGLRAIDRLTGAPLRLRASVVVDAAGPWAGRWAQGNALSTACLPRGWLGAMNLVLRRSLGIESAVALTSVGVARDTQGVLQRGRRELFFVPWGRVTMVGTHYHRLAAGEAGNSPPREAVDAFLADVRRAAPKAGIGPEDIAHIHWGLLPADSPDSVLPSRSPVVAAGQSATGLRNLIVVVAEKLTSAPVLSARVLGHVAVALQEQGIATPAGRPAMAGGLEIAAADGPLAIHLATRHGTRWPAVAALAAARPELTWLDGPAPVHGVEVAHAVDAEMALTLEDILLRRLGLGENGPLPESFVSQCAALAAAELGWSDVERDNSVRTFLGDQAGNGRR